MQHQPSEGFFRKMINDTSLSLTARSHRPMLILLDEFERSENCSWAEAESLSR
jgi:hypothetical protein